MAGQANGQTGEPREYWRRHLSDCRKSGLSYAEYCRRHDLSESTFGYWRKKLLSSPQEKPEFIELKVGAGDPGCIEIILRNQIRLIVHSVFDEAPLLRLIEVLEAF